jgi:misacylated tRNA(Ala) deacylase
MSASATDPLFLRDASAASRTATVMELSTHVDVTRLALDRTTFWPAGGGQPHDLGTESKGRGDERVRIVVEER